MTRWSVILLGSLAITLAKPALAQYAGSDASMNTDIQNAGRLSLSQDALRRAAHGQGASSAAGPDLSLNILFPGNQTGLDNIETVDLVPEGGGAHMCEALAQSKASNLLFSLFIPSKGVEPNRRYIVVVSDAVGDKYEVGHIAVAGGREQSFTIHAPLLTPNSPTFNGQDNQSDASTNSAAPAYRGAPAQDEDWRHERAPDGQYYAGPPREGRQESGYAKAEFRREASFEPWLFGMKVLTITPYMVAAIGHPGEKLRAVVVYAVLPGSPADMAGIHKGDVIAEIDGHRCFSAEQFAEYADQGRGRGATELVMYSQEAHGVVHRPITGDVRWESSEDAPSSRHDRGGDQDGGRGHRPVTGDVRWGPPAGGTGGSGRGFDRRHDDRGSGGGAWRHPAGTADFHPPTTGPGYVPPASGPAYVPPTTGPGYVPPASGPAYVPPTTGPGYVPPTTGPGFVPPGQGGAPSASTGANHPQGGTTSNWQQQQTHVPPLPPGSSDFKPPVAGPGYVPPGTTANSQPSSQPQPAPKHKTGPAPSSSGSSGFKAPSTGPGYQPPPGG